MPFFSMVYEFAEKIADVDENANMDEATEDIRSAIGTLLTLFQDLEPWVYTEVDTFGIFDAEVVIHLSKNSAVNTLMLLGALHAEIIVQELQAQGFTVVANSYLTLKDGRRVEKYRDASKFLDLGRYSEIEAINLLRENLEPLTDDAFEQAERLLVGQRLRFEVKEEL